MAKPYFLPRALVSGAALLFSLALVLLIGPLAGGAAPIGNTAPPQWGADVQINPTSSATPSIHKNSSLAVNPVAPNLVIAGFDSQENLSNSGVARSTDAGHTWTGQQFYGPWISDTIPNGNTSVGFDSQGIGYYVSQVSSAALGGYVILTSTNGTNWTTPVPIVLTDGSEHRDHARLSVDPRSAGLFANSLYMVWRYATAGPEGIHVRYSRDKGLTWSADVPVSDPGHENSKRPAITTTSNGTVYVAFETDTLSTTARLYVDRSTDGGMTWGTDHLIGGPTITEVGAPDFKGRDLVLPGGSSGGEFIVISVPFLAAGPEGGNTVYAVWNDGRWEQSLTLPGGRTGKHGDIAFSRSTDGGATWSSPARINDDALGNGIDQFHPSIAVGPNGVIGVIWHDFRDNSTGLLYNLYYSESTDGGVTWSTNQRVSDSASDPVIIPNLKGVGDVDKYSGLVYGPDYVLPSWVDTRNGGQDMFTDRGTFAAPTVTPCPISFNDVPSSNTFYPYVQYVACHGIVSGYPCGGPGEPCPGSYFRPNNNSTRGQVSKMVVIGAGWPIQTPTMPTFSDVPAASTFFAYIETAYAHGVISGYPCGGLGEPCPGRYFRPNNNVTRGQLSKIVVNAKGWDPLDPATGSFNDVPPGDTFYGVIEQARAKGLIAGYPCGGPNEPCDPPANRPYFRPGNNATRGQFSKILYLALTQP